MRWHVRVRRFPFVFRTYNHARYLPQVLESVLTQSVRPLEVLVLDDASTDDSVQVIQQYAARDPLVRLVRNERNLGVVATLNRVGVAGAG